MANVTFAASANATPASGTVVATHTINSAEHQVMHLGDAAGSILGTATSPLHAALVGTGNVAVLNLAGSAAGSPLFASITNLAGSAAGSPLFVTAAQGASGACPWGVRLLDAGGSAYGVGTGSPLYVSASITNLAGSAAGSPLFVTQNNMTGSAAGSPIFSSITNLAGSAAGSPLFTSITNTASVIVSSGSVVVTNALSASISNTVTVAQGASGAAPWGVRILDAAGSAYGVGTGSPLFVSACITNRSGSAAGSPLFASITNLAGSAAGSPLFVTQNNMAGSAAGSPIFSSITNLAGSAAGSPLFVTQNNMAGSAAGSPIFSSITNLAGSAAGSPLFTRISDGTDTAAIDSASRIGVAITDGTNAFGLAGSPMPAAVAIDQVYFGGSLLTVNTANLSASTSGCTRIVASAAGMAIVITGITFTTSSCQYIGWVASGAGAASAAVQTAMPFGTNGGMTEKDYLWAFPSGSNAILTTTSACNVAGRVRYVYAAS